MKQFLILFILGVFILNASSCQTKQQAQTEKSKPEQKIYKTPEPPKEPIEKYFTFKDDRAFYKNDYFGFSMEFSTKTWKINQWDTFFLSLEGLPGWVQFTFGPEAPFEANDHRKYYSGSGFKPSDIKFSTFTTKHLTFEMGETVPEIRKREEIDEDEFGNSQDGYLFTENPVPIFIWYDTFGPSGITTKEQYEKDLKIREQILNVIRTLKYIKPKDKKEQ